MAIGPDDVKGELALELDVPKLSSGDFLRASRAFLGLVSEVSQVVGQANHAASWDVSVSAGSQIINVYPTGDVDPSINAIADRVLEGIAELAQVAENPFNGNERAIKHLRTLGRIASRTKTAVPVRILSQRGSREVDVKIFHHASELLSWDYEDLGTVDGVLNVVSARRGYEFSISDTVRQTPVPCVVDEGLLQEALACFGKRVEVEGAIRYSKRGAPTRVKAQKIAPFPAPDEVPHYSALRGILAGHQ